MKKNSVLIIFTIFAMLLITACSSSLVSSNTTSETSSMIRTVGIGESAMPIEAGSYAIEFFNDKAISVDRINEETVIYTGTSDPEQELPEDEYSLTGRSSDKTFRYFGLNGRYGIDNYTELKMGFFSGSIKNGYKRYSSLGGAKKNYFTNIIGTQFALKQLLSDYNNPQRLSLYFDGKYISTSSRDAVAKYDGNVLEVKSALIYGYLAEPNKRSFPSLSLFYSRAYTNRNETIPGVPLRTQIQAMGLEANVNVDMKPLYYLLVLGVEKKLSENNAASLNSYFAVKLGINFNRKK